MSNKIILIFAVVLAALVIAFHSFIKKQPSGEESGWIFEAFNRPAQWQERIAPDFEIEFTGGGKFRLSDNIGKKVIILNFFATWCNPCQGEMPELNAFYEKHKKEPFILIGIDAHESADKVEAFINEFKVSFPVAIDSGAVQKIYEVRGFPTTVFIGIDGRVHIYEIGPIANADIAFDALYRSSTGLLNAGKGIDRETYLKNAAGQKGPQPAREEKEEGELALEGRAKAIAEKMYCPCGCSDFVIECNCRIAKNIKKKLKANEFSGKSDEAVIGELNREFCVRSKKGDHDKS